MKQKNITLAIIIQVMLLALPAFALAEKAVAVIEAKNDSGIAGVLMLTQKTDGKKTTVEVQGDITGLAPDSTHGFHVHQFGDCSAADGTSAGGHFNPRDMQHGGPSDMHRHVGDLGNIQSDKDGVAHLDIKDAQISLTGPNSIIGRAIIIHKDADDLKSQPTGAAGARIGCAVIGIAAE